MYNIISVRDKYIVLEIIGKVVMCANYWKVISIF
jgi:hypothetical protein